MNNLQVILSASNPTKDTYDSLPRDFKIWVDTDNKEQIVETLVKLGYKWCSGESLEINGCIFGTYSSFGLFASGKEIAWGERRDFYVSEPEPEITVEDLLWVAWRGTDE